MSRPPWFPLYPNDYDADTAELSLEQDGFYFRMLRRAWSTSPDGCSLPADHKVLARVLAISIWDVKRHRNLIQKYFKVEEVSGELRLISMRLREEASKATKRHESAALKGRLGGRPKQSSSFLPAKPEGEAQKSDSQSLKESSQNTLSGSFAIGQSPPADAREARGEVASDERENQSPPNAVLVSELERQVGRLGQSQVYDQTRKPSANGPGHPTAAEQLAALERHEASR